MFKGSNKWMLIIPGALMVFLFVGGYFYVSSADRIDHEELKETLTLEGHIEEETVSVHWDWGMLPDGEIEGEEYVGVMFYDDNDEQIHGSEVVDASVTLYQSGNETNELEGDIVDDGVIFSFPNRLDAYTVYGVEGEATIELETTVDRAEVYYLHTWENHAGQRGDDPSFEDPPFPGMDAYDYFYWVKEIEITN
ncbi:hypothetical protein [Geomicrobium sp. JCM 19055]|uniref:hypothetical protein n=1 Tax=Geomicrobium sp. JCM 19055 TaxID=1460649 RepID=UPI00045ED026|nr:hypothetical protein [Geomicrobium sp. JCM 19055]GAK01765.1 hypothetical protein JCM19055_4972 [Geomicrobium sp. JCM 19055]